MESIKNTAHALLLVGGIFLAVGEYYLFSGLLLGAYVGLDRLIK